MKFHIKQINVFESLFQEVLFICVYVYESVTKISHEQLDSFY